jgi:hypothetical protein
MNMILLKDLWVTQHGLRYSKAVLQLMTRHVAEGGFWTADQIARHHAALALPEPPQLIELVRVEDGNSFVHDGHHRCTSVWLAGRPYLRADEYHLTERTYAWYLESNPDAGYFLTFDPRIHVRSADFLSFQREAQARFQSDRSTGEKWRSANEAGYLRRRVLTTVPQFARATATMSSTR